MPTLVDCLVSTARRTLLVIGKLRQAGLHPHAPKTELVERLSALLVQPDNLLAALASLSQSERAAVVREKIAGGTRPGLRRAHPDCGAWVRSPVTGRMHCSTAYSRRRVSGEIGLLLFGC